MFSEIAERYAELVRRMPWEGMACTVTLPDHGVMTVEDAVRRRSNNPYPDGREMTDRLGGQGFRHWYLSDDIEGNTTLYASYGESSGQLRFPEPDWLPFIPWTEQIGPLAPYADKFAAVYDTWSDNPEVSVLGTCLAVIELESGVRLDKEMSRGPRTYVPMPT
ncbi:hypothetical protein [Nonomuraea bangladeshensis]|uniref:hypothetical protein n=1 Tax=Nonomuraea bangladeshensis TaxID=404385 RepID=UPI003C2B86DC